MSDAEVLLAVAAAPITVWLGVWGLIVSWFGRAALRKARAQLSVIRIAARTRTAAATIAGIDALVNLAVLAAFGGVAMVLMLTVAPLPFAVAGLDLTFHFVKIEH